MTDLYTTIALAPFLLAAVIIDHREHRIPNWLTATALAVGMACQLALNGLSGFGAALGGAAVGFGLLIVPYATKSVAAGDVKLMAAVGSFLGPVGALWAACLSMLVGAGFGLGLIFVRSFLGSDRIDVLLTSRFPYASSIALGTAAALLVMGGQWT